MLLHEVCQGQGALDVRHPVKVDAESPRIDTLDLLFRVIGAALQHLVGDVDDPHFQAEAVEVFGEARKADGVHLEDRGRGDHVADRPVEHRDLAEVVDAGGVEQNEIYHRNLYHMPGIESMPVGGGGRALFAPNFVAFRRVVLRRTPKVRLCTPDLVTPRYPSKIAAAAEKMRENRFLGPEERLRVYM